MIRGRPGGAPALAAAVVGAAFTAVSLYWAIGGTALLDTVGGTLAARGMARDAGILTVLWVTVVLKALATALPVLVVSGHGGPWWTWSRRLTWTAGVILTAYGAVLTDAGLLVVGGVVPTSIDADLRAIRRHAFFWDPWFLLWGLLVIGALLRSRSGTRRDQL